MARVDFPDSPSNGATVTANGITYIYNAAKGVWRDNATAGIASDNPPANPVEGQMWFNSTEAALYFYYNDGSSAQWVSVSGPAGTAGTDGSDGTFSGTVSQSIIPDTDSAYDLGSATNKFRSLYLSSDTLYLGDSASISAGTGGEIILPSLKIGTGANAVKLEADASGKLKTQTVISGVTQAAEEPGKATIVTDMAGLIALTGMSAGQTALVTALNKVFMYTGSAWYLIATMTNASPTAITGVDGSYDLATDGTATTITAVSTDPEGFPLTWSYAVTTGSLGSTAAVSQADNVFTITPSTTEADAGTFSITFSVTDGATGAVSAVSAFTLAFAPVQIGSDTIYTTGSGTYSIPSGANYVRVYVTGAGSGGGGASGFNTSWYHSGGGGAGGTAIGTLAVTEGQNITYTVGAGGARGSGIAYGTDGGHSTLNYNSTDFAIGGGGNNGGPNSGGNVPHPGGIGGTATHTGMVSVTLQNGGDGGNSSGPNLGGDGGTSYYGAGGAGGPEHGTAATASHYGAGGGGAGTNAASTRNGGAGADGYIVIQAWTGAP